ncbi:MAG: ATP-grasp domain-containing protein [Planctomycetota bacterium]
MKVVLLEWISGSGCYCENHTQNPMQELLDEAWEMAASLAKFFVEAGHETQFVLEESIASARAAALLEASDVGQTITIETTPYLQELQSTTNLQSVLDTWRSIARQNDLAVVIAPELDGILESCIGWLNENGIRTWNCFSDFLSAACDKWKFAEMLEATSFPDGGESRIAPQALQQTGTLLHPPTHLHSDLTPEWLQFCRAHFASQEFVIKPRFGVGCLDLYVTDSPECFTVSSSEEFIVQPLVDGPSFGCNAIVRPNEEWCWISQTRQVLHESSVTLAEYAQAHRTLEYSRSEPADMPISQQSLRAFEQALGFGALGWIGTDWVRDADGRCWLIECNARCTSSVVALQPQAQARLIDFLSKLA